MKTFLFGELEEQDYSEDIVEELLEDDELSAAEAAFLHGYEEAG